MSKCTKNRGQVFCAMLLLTVAGGVAAAAEIVQMPTRSQLQGARAYVAAIVSRDQGDLIAGRVSFLECAQRWLERANLMRSASDAPARFLLYKGVFNMATLGGDEELAMEMMEKLKAMGAPVEARVCIMADPLTIKSCLEGRPKVAALFSREYDEMKRLEKERKWTYVVDPDNGEITLTGVEPKPYTTLAIPGEIDGHRVRGVDANLLNGCTLLRALMLPESHGIGMTDYWLDSLPDLEAVFSPCKDQWHRKVVFANRKFWVYARNCRCIDATSKRDSSNFRPYPENADEIFQSM